ncbi:MAG: ArgE/DapE family deacylase [Thermoleophilaceae bacterium]|nr:ArgE/DapE family deacylase [Thermoleophilaceae bacterium]
MGRAAFPYSAGDVEELVAELVAIDSVNPALVPGAAGEAEIARFVAGWAEDAGLAVEIVEPVPGRPSVVATARGEGGGRSLMLNAHLDTVGVAGMAGPYEPRVHDGRLRGRGSYDMKGGLAACMLAAAAAARGGLGGDVLLTAVCDEEHASIGVQTVLERFRADACVVTEPTSLRVCVAHKGFAWWRITARGRAAHGSRPDLGRDAIAGMGPVLTGLTELDRALEERVHPLVGRASVHASLIEGGQELSSYPERCVLEVERRTLPGETREAVEAELRGLVARGEPGTLEGEVSLVREPFEVDPDEAIVAVLRRQASTVLGREPEVVGETPWMDAAFTSAAGVPTVVFGPHGAGAHAAEEWVDLASVRACAQVLLALATEFCDAPP